MATVIKWDDGTKRIPPETKFLGRNGYFSCIGVEIESNTSLNSRSIDLSPLTSRGQVGRCRIELPPDPATLRKIAAVLQGLASEIEAERLRKIAAVLQGLASEIEAER